MQAISRVSKAPASRFAELVLAASALHLALFLGDFVKTLALRDGWMIGPYAPFGGDFINLWTAGKLVLAGDFDRIYDPESFMAFQRTLLDREIGLRFWAYPPHSLLLVGPFGLGGFFAIFALWTILGLTLLAAGARRFGFGWAETGILVLSPAALNCVAYGQTGNLACGLMLMALSGRTARNRLAVCAAALLTVKPQIGFLIALGWLVRRRWSLIAGAVAATLALVALSVGLMGLELWRVYFTKALPALSLLEREGDGPFLYMIPSVFIAMRLLGFDPSSALAVHGVFAAIVVAALLWKLHRTAGLRRQASLIMVATCLVTPYLHTYDLTLLAAGALIGLRPEGDASRSDVGSTACAFVAAWMLPLLLAPLALRGLPVAPVIIAAIFVVIWRSIPEAVAPDHAGAVIAARG